MVGDRRRVVAVGVALVVVLGVLVLGGTKVWDRMNRSDLEAAIDVIPRGTMRVGFTDWEQVRERLGVPESTTPDEEDLERLSDGGFDSDLAAASSLDGSMRCGAPISDTWTCSHGFWRTSTPAAPA